MTEYIEDFCCDCSKPGSTWNHDAECSLWDCHAFEKGAAVWDNTIDSLVMLTAEELEQFGIDWEIEPYEGLMQAHSDAIGGQLSDTFVAPTDDPPDVDPDPMWIGDLMNDDALAKQCCDDAITKWVDSGSEVPGNFSFRGVTWVWDVTQASWVSNELGCYCENSTLNPDALICHNCQVTRKGIDSTRWYQVRYRVGEAVCKCLTKARWECKSCNVFRDYEYLPFEEFKTPASQLQLNTGGGGAVTWEGYTGTSSYNSQVYQKCRHYAQDVVFPDGTSVWASSHHQRKKDEALPDFGFYLDSIWKPECLAFYINWTDYGLPVLAWDRVVEGIRTLHKLAQTQQVEIGCIGGHGRTGTVLACLAILSGVEGKDAVKWVQANYCTHAVEGEKQEWWVTWFDATVNGKPIPEMPTFQTTTFGKKAADSHKHKDRVACCFKESNGNRYCGRCQTDLLPGEQAPNKVPETCWWCDATFVESKAEVLKHDNEWEAAQREAKQDPKAPHLKPIPNGGSATKGTGGKGKESGAESATADEFIDQVWERLWPKWRFKLSTLAGEGLRCSNCQDQVVWRWPCNGHLFGDWVHRTSPGLEISRCEQVRYKDQYKAVGRKGRK